MSEMVERVADAIDAAPSYSWRLNKANDHQYEVFKYDPKGGDIAVVKVCHYQDEAEREALIMRQYAEARAAIAAMREPTERLAYIGGTAFEDAAFGQCKLVFDGAADAWRVMIDECLR